MSLRARVAWVLPGLVLLLAGSAPRVRTTPTTATASPAETIPKSASTSTTATLPASHTVSVGYSPVVRTNVPVLLVPGWLDTARELAALRIRLVASGWPSEYVATITFDDPAGSNRDHADELAVAIDALVARTGAPHIDVIAHSMGGLATRWYLRSRPGAPVRRVAFIGSPHRGTLSAHLAWGGGREEMMPGSPFLDTLNTEQPAPTSVEAMTVRTRVDTHVVPNASATLPGVPDHELCCPTHAGLLRDDEVFDIVRRFLVERAP